MTLFDTETQEVVGDHQAPDELIFALAFDPQGDSLALTSTPGEPSEPSSATGSLEILDAATARVRSSTSLGRYPAATGQGFAYYSAAAYAPDGRSLIVTYTRGDHNFSAPVFVRRYDARRGTPLGKPVRVTPRSTTTVPPMSPDGRLLVSTTTAPRPATYAIDAETLRVIRRYPVSRGQGRQSRRAHRRDLGHRRAPPPARPRLWQGADAAGLRARAPSLQPRRAYPLDRRGQWERDPMGRRGGGPDRNPRGPRGHQQDSTHAFSPDGRTLYTAGDDGRVIVWDVAGDRRLGRPFPTGYRMRAGRA